MTLAGGLVAGVLCFAAFPPLSWWWAAVPGCALLLWSVRGAGGRLAALSGLLAGLALFVPLLSWLRAVGVDAWLVLAAVQSLWYAALGAGLALVGRLRWWWLWSAALWVTEEWARGRVPFGGFTWGRVAFSQAGAPTVGWAAVAGAPLVTFAVALAGALLLLAAGRGARVVARVGGLLAAVAVLLGGLLVPRPVSGETAHGPASARVAVVQGNVPRLGLGAFDQERAVIRDHVAATQQLAARVRAGAAPRPDLVAWPENSSDLDPYTDAEADTLISSAVHAIGAPILVGAVLDGPGPHSVRNAGIVWSPATGPGSVYIKQHPVPFGEYLPMRSVLSHLIGRFSLIPKDFVAGHRPGVLSVGPARIGDVICFEVAYDNVVRDAVTTGGRVIVVQTNDATFEHVGDSGRSGESAQQLDIGRLRAVEHGRAVLVAATSGVSAVIAPDGRVEQRSGVFTRAVLSATVPLRDSRTLADRLAAGPEWCLALLGCLGVGVALWRRRRGAGERAA